MKINILHTIIKSKTFILVVLETLSKCKWCDVQNPWVDFQYKRKECYK